MRVSRKLVPICVLTAGVMLIASLNLLKPSKPDPLPPVSQSTVQHTPYRYILRTEAGELAVFAVEHGVSTRIAAFPFAETTLPEQDRRELEQGIALENAEQLQRALEDYLPESS